MALAEPGPYYRSGQIKKWGRHLACHRIELKKTASWKLTPLDLKKTASWKLTPLDLKKVASWKLTPLYKPKNRTQLSLNGGGKFLFGADEGAV